MPQPTAITPEYRAQFQRQPIADILAPIAIHRELTDVRSGRRPVWVRTSPDCDACGRAATWLLDSMPVCDKCLPGLLRNRLPGQFPA